MAERKPEFPHLYVGHGERFPSLYKQNGGQRVADVTMSGYRVGSEASPLELAQLFAASPRLYNAAKWAKSALENPTDKLLAKEALEHLRNALEDARKEA